MTESTLFRTTQQRTHHFSPLPLPQSLPFLAFPKCPKPLLGMFVLGGQRPAQNLPQVNNSFVCLFPRISNKQSTNTA